jgi:hypothetical protein
MVAPEGVFDAHLLQLLGVAVSPAMGAEEKGQKLSEMLMDIVIDVVGIAHTILRCNSRESFFSDHCWHFSRQNLPFSVSVWFATPSNERRH